MEKLNNILPDQRTPISTPPSRISPQTRLSDSQAPTVTLDDIAPERRRAWTEILTEAYAALLRELPGGNRLKLLIRAFEEVNRRIPTRLLRRVYAASMRLRNEQGFPGYWDARTILAAYENAPEGTWSEPDQGSIATVSEDTAANCRLCFGVGMRTIPAPGRPGYTAAIKCDHIPPEVRLAEIDPNCKECLCLDGCVGPAKLGAGFYCAQIHGAL